MKVYKDDLTQLRFEEFVDKLITGNEVVLIEECIDKFENNSELTAEDLERSFLAQCSVYFELTSTLSIATEIEENQASNSILH